jgi:phosphoribosyl-ATP pyrophosphohydrolase
VVKFIAQGIQTRLLALQLGNYPNVPEASGYMSDMLYRLEKLIADRRANMPADSYTTTLFQKGRNKITQKVGEEATEVIVAALGQGREDQVNELADLFYHTLVLMADLDISLEDVSSELEKRHISG